MNKKIAMIGLLLLNSGCQKPFKNEREYYKWWNNEKNGLIKSRTIDEFKITVRYMPPQYIAYNELKNKTFVKAEYDSLIEKYKLSRTFLMTIEPIDKDKDVDVLFHGIESYGEYKERIMQLNFSPGDFITLKAGSQVLKPVLSTMENAYNIEPKKNVYLVFNGDKENNALLNSEEMDFEFDDQIFLTGINHFIFKKSNVDNVPGFAFLK